MVDKLTEIRLIYSTQELEGTCYFEFLPGEYKDKCWNLESVFIDEALFNWLQPTLWTVCPDFDHYSFETYPKKTWEQILHAFDELAITVANASGHNELRRIIGMGAHEDIGVFADDFSAAKERVVTFLQDLCTWIRKTLETEESISILGM